jgi:hypothetical protein
LSDIHFTALFTSLYRLTFILLLCMPHYIVWHSFYCSVYLIVLSDINKQSNKMNKQSSKMNVRQYNGVNRAVKWINRAVKWINRAVKVWHSFYCSVYPILLSDIHFTALYTPLYYLTFILLLCMPHYIVWHSFYCSVYLIVLSDIHFTAWINRAVKWINRAGKWINSAIKWINRAVKWM